MVLVAFAIDPFSLRQVLLLLLSLLHLEHLFNKQGLKPRQTRLSTWPEGTIACGGFFSVKPHQSPKKESSSLLGGCNTSSSTKDRTAARSRRSSISTGECE